MAIISLSSVQAITLNVGGRLEGSTIREWYLPTSILGGSPLKRTEESKITVDFLPCFGADAFTILAPSTYAMHWWPKTHPQGRNGRGEARNNLVAHSCVLRVLGTRRNNDV